MQLGGAEPSSFVHYAIQILLKVYSSISWFNDISGFWISSMHKHSYDNKKMCILSNILYLDLNLNLICLCLHLFLIYIHTITLDFIILYILRHFGIQSSYVYMFSLETIMPPIILIYICDPYTIMILFLYVQLVKFNPMIFHTLGVSNKEVELPPMGNPNFIEQTKYL